jgi:hypothetical protein
MRAYTVDSWSERVLHEDKSLFYTWLFVCGVTCDT